MLKKFLSTFLVLAVIITASSANFAQYVLRRSRRETTQDDLCTPLKALHVDVKCTFQGKDVSCKGLMQPGTIATPTCQENYKPALNSEPSLLTCLRDGYWDYPLLQCTPENLCPPLRSRNTNVKCMLRGKEVSCNRHMEPGTIATPTCKDHCKLPFEPGYSQLTCLSHGDWDHLLFYCVAECGESNEVTKFSPLIVDGTEAHVGAFPWHAGLYYRQEDSWIQRCGGSLVTDQFVLTAAHCVANSDKNDIRVALGKYYRAWDRQEPNEEKRNVSNISYPRGFSSKIFTFDIALLLLDKKIMTGEFIMPVCHGFLDGSNDIRNKPLFVVGWGLTNTPDGKYSNSEKLLYNDVEVVPPNVCLRNAPSVFPTFDKFCTTKTNNSGVSIAQQGDSGGGLTVVHDGLHFLFGVVSTRFKEYSMFTNVTWPYNILWVENEIRKYDSNFSWVGNADQISRGCLLPEASASRKFCSMAEGCENCDVHDKRCFIPPGTEVDRVRVVCAPGYTLQSPVSPDSAICLSGQSWYPEVPECVGASGNMSPHASQSKYIPGYPWSKVSWRDARDNCLAFGNQLAVIKSQKEQKIFEEAVRKKFNETGAEPSSIWIGLSDIRVEGKFEWEDGCILGGSGDEELNWIPGEPTNSEGVENCVQASAGCGMTTIEHIYKWNDNFCSELNYFFCKVFPQKNSEVPLQSLTVPQRSKYIPGNPWKTVTWKEARDNCLAIGSQLAIIRTEEQQQLFEKAVTKQFNKEGLAQSGIWLGLSDLKLKEGLRRFEWLDGSVQSPWRRCSYSNWLPNEPNNAGSKEFCVEAYAGRDLTIKWPNGSLYQWNDSDCDFQKYYFCNV